MTTLRDPLVEALGKGKADALAKAFEMSTVGDLLRHYPRRYANRGELTELSTLRAGDHVTVLARVDRVHVAGAAYDRHVPGTSRGKSGQRLEVTITDGTAPLQLVFFGALGMHRSRLVEGRLGLFAGKVDTFRHRRQLVHPEYVMLEHDMTAGRLTAERAQAYAAEIIPVYPATAAVSSWTISTAIDKVLDTLDAGDDPLPPELRERHGLWTRGAAIHAIHRPEDYPADRDAARKRLRFDEAFILQAALAQRRQAAAAMPAMPRPPVPDGISAEFDRRLPFTLTEGQRNVGEVIAHDLSCAYPMNRLLQGEVGSGKTVVAIRAMLQVIDAGGQAVLLAPTEVLAQQHYRSITAMLGPLAEGGLLGGAEHATRVALLTGSTGAKARRAVLSDAFTGDAGILVGTHALLEDRVQFADLSLVVIDEQHRFGVEQRDALREKAPGARPHVLVMTATPIPRTVAMTVFGDLEVSTLSELPAGRSPIATHVVPALERPRFLERTWERVREEVAAGRQAYVVCPRIGGAEGAADNDGLDDAAAAGEEAEDTARRPPLAVLDVAPELTEGPLSGLRVGVLHGRLTPDEKDTVMSGFAAGEIDVLIATTVIEVGVDVPNATVMVILDAERFGVSQLHQLRGRVGRGGHAGLCLLVTEMPSPSPSRERLEAVAATTDGFALSRLDLEQRREGDVLGAAQAGRRSRLKLLRLLQDEELIAVGREEAVDLITPHPHLTAHPALREAIDDLLGDDRAEFLDKG